MGTGGEHPEGTVPPTTYYDEEGARRYEAQSRIQQIQREMTERAVELLELPPDGKSLVLDLGCGTGLSGQILSEHGLDWVGIDIAPAMLEIAADRIKPDSDEMEEDEMEDDETTNSLRRTVHDLLCTDMGQPTVFRTGIFDAAISISAVQWLCHAFSSDQNPQRRLHSFFRGLYSCLCAGARAILQVYPEHTQQLDLITKSAALAGFQTGVVIDNPESDKKKKIYITLGVGRPFMSGEESEVRATRKPKREPIKPRDWVLKKKEQQRKRGIAVRPDTKYTARTRRRAPN